MSCRVLISAFLLFIPLLGLTSCSGNDLVEEYFDSHGMKYPVDVTGVSLWGMDYAGIEDGELSEPGARDFVESGIVYIKGFFIGQNVQALMPGTSAMVISKPVFYRGESEEVGLMVRVTAYGEGEPGSMVELPVEWIGEKKRFWKIVNFAYFNPEGFYEWKLGGWVY